MERRRRIPTRLVAGVAVVLLLVMAGSVVYRAVTAAPGPLVNYHRKLYQLSVSAQPAGPEQWLEFESVLTTVLGIVRGENLFEYQAIRAVGSPLHAEAEKREELGARGRQLIERYRELGVF